VSDGKVGGCDDDVEGGADDDTRDVSLVLTLSERQR
jgi:hypothetical protein